MIAAIIAAILCGLFYTIGYAIGKERGIDESNKPYMGRDD